MAKTCDICGAKLGLLGTFHCQDGVVCKNCYRIVSGNYSTTIAKMTLAELKRLYIRNAQPLDMGGGGFRITRRIGSFLLLDEENRKFCLLNNQKLTGRNTRPEIFPYGALEQARLVCDPRLPAEGLAAFHADKSGESVVKWMAVRLTLKDGGRRDIVIIPTPVRTSSFAFRQSCRVAQELLDCLSGIAASR